LFFDTRKERKTAKGSTNGSESFQDARKNGATKRYDEFLPHTSGKLLREVAAKGSVFHLGNLVNHNKYLGDMLPKYSIGVCSFWTVRQLEEVRIWDFLLGIVDAPQWNMLMQQSSPKIFQKLSRLGLVILNPENIPLEQPRTPLHILDIVTGDTTPKIFIEKAISLIEVINLHHHDRLQVIRRNSMTLTSRSPFLYKFALIDHHHNYGHRLWEAARKQNAQLDLFTSVEHFNEFRNERKYDALVLDFDLGPLAGVDESVILQGVTGSVPSLPILLLTRNGQNNSKEIANHVRRTPKSFDFDQIVQAAIDLSVKNARAA
jgi:hypothetical protein